METYQRTYQEVCMENLWIEPHDSNNRYIKFNCLSVSITYSLFLYSSVISVELLYM